MKRVTPNDEELHVLNSKIPEYSATTNNKEKSAIIQSILPQMNTNGINKEFITKYLRENSKTQSTVRKDDDSAFPEHSFSHNKRRFTFHYQYPGNGFISRHYTCSCCGSNLCVKLFPQADPIINESAHKVNCQKIEHQ